MEQEIQKQLVTERLRLRRWSLKDAEECYLLAKNPKVGPPAGWKPHENAAESQKVIEEIFLSDDVFAVTDRKDGRILGCIGLTQDNRRLDAASRELGYWLAEEAWGQGLMTEAALAMIDYGFEERSLEVISISTGPENKRSQGVIRKCGFTYEGTLRRSFRIYDGSIRDTLCYSLLREEWEASR